MPVIDMAQGTMDERLKELSAKGDMLDRLKGLVDFELFRPDLERAVPRADRSRASFSI
jgi:transposase, IS5 family